MSLPRFPARGRVSRTNALVPARGVIRAVGLAACLAGLALLGAGCRREPEYPAGRPVPNPSAAPKLPPVAGGFSTNLPVYQPAGSRDTNWLRAPFHVVESSLTPAVLVHSDSRYLGLFTGMSRQGLGGPTRVAWSTKEGPRTFKAGETLDVSRLEENWLLVWFAGARGWTNWDSPWAVFLQHPPSSMKLDGEGLHLTFTNQAGDVVLLPLYGAFKPAVSGRDLMEQNGMPSRKVSVRTADWDQALPRDPLVRLRLWASASRRFPLHAVETFRVNPADDTVTIRTEMAWHEIEDDWRTKPLKLLPVSPTLSLAARDSGFPVRFSEPPLDLGLFTTQGPCFGVMDADQLEATFSILQYVHETAAAPDVAGAGTAAGATNAATVSALVGSARARLQQAAGELVASGLADASGGVDWAAAAVLARALPELEASGRANAIGLLRRAIEAELVRSERLGAGVRTGVRDGSRWERLSVLWALGHEAGDWSLARSRWPVIRSWFPAAGEIGWSLFGREEDGAPGVGAAGCAAFARLAHAVGDADGYAWACAVYARELTQLWARQRGGEYFRNQQPVHSMEYLDDEVYPVWAAPGVAGWQLDGPRYPAGASVRRHADRWTRFGDRDLGRFHRDYLRVDVRRELDGRLGRLPKGGPGEAAERTALVAARGLALGEGPEALAAVVAPSAFAGRPATVLAAALAVVQSAAPERYERLIGGSGPTPPAPGPEREPFVPRTALATELRVRDAAAGPAESGAARWPEPGWAGWTTPTGAPWGFGQIKPVRSGAPRAVRELPLNWTTRVLVFDLP